MRLTPTLLLALPALAVAEQQPLGGLFDKVKGALGILAEQTEKVTDTFAAYIPTKVPTPKKNPVNVASGKVSDFVATKLNMSNWEKELKYTPGSTKGKEPQEWMVFMTGGNNTCNGLCQNVTQEWNKAVTLLAPLPNRPKLAYTDCDKAPVLCAMWNTNPPLIWHFRIPQPLADQSRPATETHRIRLNKVNTTATDIVKLHTEKGYTKYPVYEGAFHPFDGWMHTSGIAYPYAWLVATLASLPSWAPMILISFGSRALMSRKARGRAIPGQVPGQAPGAQPAGAASARAR